MNISILGCGWLGLPLGAELVRRGHTVRGSVTRAEGMRALEEAGVIPHRLELTPSPEGDTEGFFGADTLLITLPPKRSEAGVRARYPAQIAAVLERTPPDTHLVFTGSSSVYPEGGRTVTEVDAGARDDTDTADPNIDKLRISESGRAILEAETLIRERGATILRLAGLYGYDRQPGRRLSGRALSGGGVPVNLVHRDDVLRVLLGVIQNDIRDITLNVCADLHPTRREVYTRQAERYGFTPPLFGQPEKKPFKHVSSERLKEVLGFAFRYPDPLGDAP